jgi:hypothetical protein
MSVISISCVAREVASLTGITLVSGSTIGGIKLR